MEKIVSTEKERVAVAYSPHYDRIENDTKKF